MDFWGFEGRETLPGDGFGLFDSRVTLSGGSNTATQFDMGSMEGGNAAVVQELTKEAQKRVDSGELTPDASNEVTITWEQEVSEADWKAKKNSAKSWTTPEGIAVVAGEPKDGKVTLQFSYKAKVTPKVAEEPKGDGEGVDAAREGEGGGATVQAQAAENPPEESPPPDTTPPDKTPPDKTPPDQAPEAKPEKPGLLFNVNLGWGQASSTQTSLGLGGGYGSPYSEAVLSSSSYNFGSIGVSNSGEGLGIGSGPGFIDFSNTGFMIRQQYSDTKRKARELDRMIDQLLAAINQGNFDAIESALTLINLKSKTTALDAAKEMVKGMQHYDQQTKKAQDRITGLINNQGMSDINKNAELGLINSEMGQYSMFRQALQNSMRDVLSMVEQMTDLENSYRQRSERIKGSSTRWA